MREVCQCPYCGGDHPHVCRIEGDVKLCWCQWCYGVHELPVAADAQGPANDALADSCSSVPTV